MTDALNQPATAEDILQMYQTLLGRKPEPGITEQLIQKGASRAYVETMIQGAGEYRTKGRLHFSLRATPGYANTYLVFEPARLVFCPIAKNGNSSIKKWFLRLSGQAVVPDSEVHALIDGGAPGLQFLQHTDTALNRYISDPDWVFAAVLRDPLDRLVSAYWDKLVKNRRNPFVADQLAAPIYRYAYQTREVKPEMIEQGITFAQFCSYIWKEFPHNVDSHWCRQSNYLDGFHWDHLFTIAQTDAFERLVRDRAGDTLSSVPLNRLNVAPVAEDAPNGNLSHVKARDLEPGGKPPASAFRTPEIDVFVRHYYAMDHLLLSRTARNVI